MRFIKHICTAHTDPIMAELIEEFGPAGYGIWWIILEKIGQEMDETDRVHVKFATKNWQNSTRTRKQHFNKVVSFLQEKGCIELIYEGKYLTIKCPNLLKYKDEWSKRQARETHRQLRSDSGETPDKLQSYSGIDIRYKNEDKEKETNKEKEESPDSGVTSEVGSSVKFIFSHWQKKLNHPKAKLDTERKNQIAKALKLGFTAEQLCKAIDGCAVTPHNLGHNDRGERYDGLHVIFKNAQQIERFIQHAEQPPKPPQRDARGQIIAPIPAASPPPPKPKPTLAQAEQAWAALVDYAERVKNPVDETHTMLNKNLGLRTADVLFEDKMPGGIKSVKNYTKNDEVKENFIKLYQTIDI